MQRALVTRLAPALLAGLLLGLSCSGDDGNKDTGVLDQGPLHDVIGADEPFGRACTIGEECPADPRGFPLLCISVQGSTPGKGFCTPQCSDVGPECYDAPNGQWAQCFIESAAPDGSVGTKYCGFLCQMGDQTWTCPGTLSCEAANQQGQAICLP